MRREATSTNPAEFKRFVGFRDTSEETELSRTTDVESLDPTDKAMPQSANDGLVSAPLLPHDSNYKYTIRFLSFLRTNVLDRDNFWSMFYLIFWFFFNVIITLYCKALFVVYSFPYPMLMTAIHMVFTYCGVLCCRFLGLYTSRPLPPGAWKTLLWFSFVFTVNIWLSNAGLLAVSINLHQVFRTTIPLFTMLLTLLLYNETYSLTLLPPVLTVILGVAATAWGDMDVTIKGLIIVFLGCFFSSLKGIITQKTQVGALGLSSLELLRYLCPLAALQLIVFATFTGEVSSLASNQDITIDLIIHLIILGWIAFALNFVSFRCAALLSPLTLNVAANVKQVLTSVLGISFFGGFITSTLLFGITSTAIGAYWYSQEMSKWQQQHVKSQVPPLQKSRSMCSTTDSSSTNADGSNIEHKRDDLLPNGSTNEHSLNSETIITVEMNNHRESGGNNKYQ